jgi:uncharacterized protein YrrD
MFAEKHKLVFSFLLKFCCDSQLNKQTVTGAHLGAVAGMVFVGEAQAAQRLLATKGGHSRHHFLLHLSCHPELARPIITHHLQGMQLFPILKRRL